MFNAKNKNYENARAYVNNKNTFVCFLYIT